jgi:outer membrane protein
MQKSILRAAAVALVLAALASTAGAQEAGQANVVKLGATYYTTHSKTNGISGIGVPAGADAETNNATTAILVYERLVLPNIGIEFVIGAPPRIKAKATGSVAFLGDDVLSARFIAPTLLLNYHFFAPTETLRPYVGAGINYTRFTSIRSSLASDVKMGDSTGLVLQAGLDYALTRNVGLFASVAKLDVKSKVVASGSTVLTTTVDFRPIVYSAGVSYRF